MKNSFILLSIFITLITTMVIVGCGDDGKSGCTDPEAENYDPTADSNNQSSCIYPRNKFVGEYAGSLNCEALLSLLINGEADFSIDESSKGVQFVDITINTNTQVLRLEAEVIADTMHINTYIPGLTISELTYDLTATGKVGISSNEQMVSGLLSILLENENGNISDECMIMGEKK